MDQAIRNKLRNVVTQCRKLLEDAVAQVLQGQFGIYATGKKDEVHVDDDAKMTHLSDEDRAYRKDILDHLEHVKALGYKATDSLAQLVREIAFTHLNRFCAYKMMEARNLIRESVSKGLKSQGFLFYLADHEDDEKRANSGQQDVAYRHFLNWLGGTLSEEIGVLFNPHDSANRLYPPQRVLDDVLVLLNDEALAEIWTQDETIGWVYQYFTPKELRDQVRKESQAPRNSYELAFRNQFFTPRYVVEFLTDNTLGRIWYEMRKGETQLKDQCRYMVRRPTEIFLQGGEQPPEDAAEGRDDLSQEELLKLPLYIPHRPKKDPRELKILDPACGSGHFLLYCFDLLLTIYEEAYGDPELGPALQKDYPTFDTLKRDVPRLILANNLHGIDIDLRATQIAALALWLRCQRAYQDMGLKKDRPKITRSNFVCAEPMPGEPAMLKEFVGQLEPRLLGQLVEVVFDKMKLAGEAGSLLKIEEEIRTAVASAKQQWETGPVEVQKTLFDRSDPKPKQKRFNLSGVTDNEFFNEAETKVVEALRNYAEKAQSGQRLQRRLFTEDAVRGFAFVDVCHKRFDVILMNPPFGKPSTPSLKRLKKDYPDNWKDLYAAFFERTMQLSSQGLIGAITSSQFLYTKQMRQLRQSFVERNALLVFVKLGPEVLDGAAVDTGLSILALDRESYGSMTHVDVSSCPTDERASQLLSGMTEKTSAHFRLHDFSHIATTPFAFHSCPSLLRLWNDASRLQPNIGRVATGNHTFDDERFVRLRWEVPTEQIDQRWKAFEKGGEYQPFFMASPLLLDWKDDGSELRKLNVAKHGSDAQVMQSSKYWYKPGLCYSHVSSVGFGPRVLPQNAIFSSESIAVLPKSSDDRLPLLGILCSTISQEMVNVFGEYRKIENRAVANIPLSKSVLDHNRELLSQCAEEGVRLVMQLESLDETSPLFRSPDCVIAGQLKSISIRDEIHNRLVALYERLDRASEAAFQIPPDHVHIRSRKRAELARVFVYRTAPNQKSATQSLLSFFWGVALGRWKSCRLGHENLESGASSLFAALPIHPPAATRVSLGKEHPTTDVLVDDADHADDIVRRIRAVGEAIWREQADSLEKEACEYLGVSELRDYFRKPNKGGFWDDHVSRYSKSRRNAPIYWLLQSSKKNYAVWLYYHRIDKDLLFKALVNYVEPKIRLEVSRLDSLRSEKAAAGDSGKVAKKIDKEIEKQEDFISELRDFEDKLRRVADLHLEPDLNDGVVLNIAPLHELIPWKEAKSYWNELLKGKFEWSSIGKQLRQKGLVK